MTRLHSGRDAPRVSGRPTTAAALITSQIVCPHGNPRSQASPADRSISLQLGGAQCGLALDPGRCCHRVSLAALGDEAADVRRGGGGRAEGGRPGPHPRKPSSSHMKSQTSQAAVHAQTASPTTSAVRARLPRYAMAKVTIRAPKLAPAEVSRSAQTTSAVGTNASPKIQRQYVIFRTAPSMPRLADLPASNRGRAENRSPRAME